MTTQETFEECLIKKLKAEIHRLEAENKRLRDGLKDENWECTVSREAWEREKNTW